MTSMATLPSPSPSLVPSYEELEQAVERAYREGLDTISCPPPAESKRPSLPGLRTPKLPSRLGAYDNLFSV